MQGEIFSSILCTSTMDVMAKECTIEPYMYRDCISVPKLGFVDDLVDIQECGNKSKEMNSYTNNEFNKRKLQCGVDKCHRMHVGKEKSCENVQIENWEIQKSQRLSNIQLQDIHKD